MDPNDEPDPSISASTPATAACHAAPTNNNPPSNTTTPTNTIANSTSITNTATQPPTAQHPNHASNGNTPSRANIQSQETLFNVPDLNLAQTASPAAYRQHVLTLHKEMAGGDATEYFESRIALPRSLQGLKTSQVIARLLAHNPSLDAEKWTAVTADVVGANLILGTMNKTGRELIDSLNELKVEPGRSSKVPPASKPNNLYNVEILLPQERELHVAFMEAFLLSFPSAKYISMPGKKPFGTTRRLRLYFNTTTAPREVFTKEDPNIPIREVLLPCGTAAQIIHKWQRLNQFRPPHLANRWNQPTATRTYAAAALATPPIQTEQRNVTNNALQPSSAANQPPRPARRTGEVPNGPPPPTTSLAALATEIADHPQVNRPNEKHADQADWMIDEPFPPSNAETSQHEARPQDVTNATPVPMDLNNAATQPHDTPSHHPPHTSLALPKRSQLPRGPPTNTTNTPSNIPRTRRSSEVLSSATKQLAAPTTRAHNATTNQALPTPPSTEEAQQWQQVSRSRSRTANHHTQTSTMPALKKSVSRNRKQKASNKFAPLDFVILPSFDDDDAAPIEITLPEKPVRPPRRKHRTSKKAFPKQAAEALAHPQQIRHPANTLQHLSPKQTQVLRRTKDSAISPGRDNLIRQLALLRAARTNTNPRNITLDPIADQAFIQQLQCRLADCTEPPNSDESTPIDIPLNSILEQDEMRVRGSICYALLDLASRGILPHLYDAWPDPPSWNGKTLNWLPSTDGETPCLQDEGLALLAACPSLHNIWQHLTASTPDLQTAIRTAAAQWHSFTATEKNLDITPAPTTSHQ